MASIERNIIKAELKQMREQGCNTQEIEIRILESINNENCEDSEFISLYEELTSLPVDPSFAFDEPSTLEEIKALRPDARRHFERVRNGVPLDSDTLYDCVYGAWLGRAAGCALGKPVEGWPKARIDKYLKEAGALPLDNYLPYIKKQMPRIHIPSSRDNIEYMDRDDDMDFTILGLLALEHAGADISARSIANMWISKMPFAKVYTAERAAYRNFTQSIWPPKSAAHRNPFREYIGAQIRADIFGYVAPGLPERAAQLAFTDASISHKKNGIYGEMFVAAMIAAAFITDKAEEIIAAGLGEIPANCRLAGAVRDTLCWCQQESDWEVVWGKIYNHYGHYHTVHTINNAALVVMGVYYGCKDFELGIVSSVRAGWDTDCNGATVGSILGIVFGAKALPHKWVGVLNNRLISAVSGETDNQISDLAQRTVQLIDVIALGPKKTCDRLLEWDSGGMWELETGWGPQRLDFGIGTIEFKNDDFGPYSLTASNFQNPELHFSFSIDKDGWDFEVDFEGSINADILEGLFYPGEISVHGKKALP